jgi:TusA-related sulfurtransferase
MKKIKDISISDEIRNEFISKLPQCNKIFNEIFEICNFSFEKGCGSYLFDGITYEYCDKMFEKQLLLYDTSKKMSNVLEIGTYLGHSLTIMLLANPNLKITSIDINNQYTLPAINLLNKIFDNNITFIHGNSLDTLPSIKDRFDFFHIDGTHNLDFVVKELDFCKNMSTSDTLNVIFDDYDTIKDIKEMIEKNHIILEQVTPNCSWRNSFMKIKL